MKTKCHRRRNFTSKQANAYNFIESFPEKFETLWAKEELNFPETTTTYCHCQHY
jgi:hypothetical protein